MYLSKYTYTMSTKCQFSIFQVGGHSKLIKVGNGCIGKPLIPRELEMYRLRPPKLAPFMPEFKGSRTPSS